MRHLAALLLLAPAHAQVRCGISQIKQSDGSFRISPACEHVLLFGANIGDDGIAKLAPALATATRLQFLDLWSNGIGPKGAQV